MAARVPGGEERRGRPRPDPARGPPGARARSRRHRRRPRRRRQGRVGAPSSPAPAPSGSRCRPTPSSASATGSTPPAGAADAAALGQARRSSTRCLAAAIEEPEGEGVSFTGRISLADPPLAGRPRRRAAPCSCPAPPSSSWPCGPASEVGAATVEELTLQAPLVLPEAGRGRDAGLASRPRRGGRARDRDPLPPRGRGQARVDPQRQRRALAAEPPAAARAPERMAARGRRAARASTTSTTASPRSASSTARPSRASTAAWRDGEEIYAEVVAARGAAPEAERFGDPPGAARRGRCTASAWRPPRATAAS